MKKLYLALHLAVVLAGFTGVSSYQLGIVLGTISSAFAALYTLSNERLVQHYDSKLINYYQMLGGTIGLGILLPVYLYLSSRKHYPKFERYLLPVDFVLVLYRGSVHSICRVIKKNSSLYGQVLISNRSMPLVWHSGSLAKARR